MSAKVVSWALREAPVSRASDLLTLIAIAEHAHEDGGGAFPALSTIAAMARMSERNVRYAIRRLERAELLSVESRSGRSSVYRVHITPARVAGVDTGASVADPPRQALPTHPGNGAPDPGNHVPEPRQELLPPIRKEPSEKRTPPNPPAVRGGRQRDRDRAGQDFEARREAFIRDHPCELAGKRAAAWQRVLTGLQSDDPSLAAFLAGSHPHLTDTDDALIIGVNPQCGPWLRDRLTNGHRADLARRAGRQIEIFDCPHVIAGRPPLLSELTDDELLDVFPGSTIEDAE